MREATEGVLSVCTAWSFNFRALGRRGVTEGGARTAGTCGASLARLCELRGGAASVVRRLFLAKITRLEALVWPSGFAFVFVIPFGLRGTLLLLKCNNVWSV